MKVKIKRWAGLLIVPSVLALLALSEPAAASPYDCDGGNNPVPSTTTGSVEITVNSGNCVISHDVTADSGITINVLDGSLDAKKLTSKTSSILITTGKNDTKTLDITAGTFVRVLAGLDTGATTGNIEINGPLTINATETQSGPPTTHGNVLLRAFGNVKTKDISTGGNFAGGGAKTGAVQIDAHLKSGQNVLFTIGADTGNGINGTVSTESVTGGGTSGTSTILGGVRITNGVAGSTGGIEVKKMNRIKVRASQSRSGWIQLNAHDGVITLPSGKLNADGMGFTENEGQPNESTTYYMAGAIYLTAKTIEADEGTVISASQNSAAAGSVHQVVIASQEIKYKGVEALKIRADGNGVSQSPFLPATIYILPKGGLNPTSTGDQNNVTTLLWTNPFSGQFFFYNGLVTFDGTGGGTDTASLLISANGDHSQIAITGHPINFIGGDVTIRAKGTVNHQIVMGYFGAATGGNGITFEGTGDVVIDANAKDDGDGGYVQIDVKDRAIFGASDLKIRADGPNSGNGNGGQVILNTGSVALTSKALISADAASSGVGDAISSPLNGTGPQAIKFFPGSDDILLGGGVGQFKLTARGGDQGGNAGGIIITPTQGNITVKNRLAVDASSPGTTGDGGKILIAAPAVQFTAGKTGNPTKTALKAAGGSDLGDGGEIILNNPVKPIGTPVDSGLAVASHMNVDSGQLNSTLDFNGSITINGVTCQRQPFNSDGSFPSIYWNCVNPGAPTAFDLIAPTVGSSIVDNGTRQRLEDHKTNIFVHANPQNHNLFFVDVSPASGLGLTFVHPFDQNEKIHVSIFEGCTDCAGRPGATTLTNLEFAEIVSHELGHAIDFSSGSQSESNQAPYPLYEGNDSLHLDFAVVGVDQPSSIMRLPCSPTPNPAGGDFGPAPFDGVMYYPAPDQAPIDLCEAGSLVISVPNGTLNSTIMKGLGAHVSIGELYAQTFAHRTNANPADYVDPVADGVFSRSAVDHQYFQCTGNRAEILSRGTGMIDPACTIAIPAWYTALRASQ